jgi:hypothetical protein
MLNVKVHRTIAKFSLFRVAHASPVSGDGVFAIANVSLCPDRVCDFIVTKDCSGETPKPTREVRAGLALRALPDSLRFQESSIQYPAS